jgi:hypothetical protein
MGRNSWTSALNQMESTLKGIKVLFCKIKYRFVIDKFLFHGPPSLIRLNGVVLN